jgi:sugar/nucleoside kinase (ribokinase family)
MGIGVVGMLTIDHLLFTQRPLAAGYDDGHEGLSWVTDSLTCVGGKGGVPAMYFHEESVDFSLTCLTGRPGGLGELLPLGFPTEFIVPGLDKTHEVWATIDAADGVHSYVYLGSADISPRALSDVAARLASSADIFYLSCEDSRLLAAILHQLPVVGKPVVTNLSLPLMLVVEEANIVRIRSIVDVSDCLIMNEREAAQALRLLELRDWTDLGRSMEIVITNGADGGRFSSDELQRWYQYHAVRVSGVACEIGAGDTFAAAYVRARFVDRLAQADSCDYAAKAAAAKLRVKSSSVRSARRAYSP